MSGASQIYREVRKIQVTGGSTYIVSLPKKWAAEMGLKQGSQIALMRNDDNSLLIVPQEGAEPQEPAEALLRVGPDEDPNFIVREFIAAYLVGYNTIRLRSSGTRIPAVQRNAIKNFTHRKLVGTEVVEDSPDELVIRVLIGYPELSVQSALKRISLITSSMHKDAIAALKDLNAELANDVIAMDDEVDRFNMYIIRQLKAAVEDSRIIREIGLTSGRDCLGYRVITKTVERTADHAVEIAKNVSALKIPLEPALYEQINTMSASAVSIFNEATDSLFKQDFQLANNIVEKAKHISQLKEGMMKSVLMTTDPEEVSRLSLIVESITRVAEYASDVAEIAMNMNVQQVTASNN